MQVLVQIFGDKNLGRIYPLKVETSDLIFSVKVQMYAKNGVRPDESRIVKPGGGLLEDSCTFSDYGIQKDDLLLLVTKRVNINK